MGAIILAAGTKGRRKALPHARIMIHQPMGGARGQASDIQIQAQEIQRMKEVLSKILGIHSGHPLDKVMQDSDRDYYMSAIEAKEYGLIDDVVLNKKSISDEK